MIIYPIDYVIFHHVGGFALNLMYRRIVMTYIDYAPTISNYTTIILRRLIMLKLKTMAISLLLTTFVFSTPILADASPNVTDLTSTQEETSPHILQVLIVSNDGNSLYVGDEAERVYSELKEETNIVSENIPIENSANETPTFSTSSVAPTGAFKYKYRFVPDSKNGTKRYGNYSIVSNAFGNGTSTTQSASISVTSSASWIVNCTLTGEYKNAVALSIGSDWSKTYSSTVSIPMRVLSKKRVWLEYRPEYILHSGKSEKYYVTRGTGITIVESSQDVNIWEAYETSTNINGNNYTLPAGTYVWCEDDDYMSHNPPAIQH